MLVRELKNLLSHKTVCILLLIFPIGILLSNLYFYFSPNNTQLTKDISSYHANTYSYGNDDLDERIYYVSSYDSLQEEIDSNIQKLSSSLFSSAKNQAELTQQNEVLTKLSDTSIVVQNDYQISQQFNTRKYWSFSLIAFAFYMIHILIQEEKESDVLRLYSTTITSKTNLFLSKIGTIIVTLLLLSVIKEIIDVFFLYLSSTSLRAPIQCIYDMSFKNVYMSTLSFHIIMNIETLISVIFIISISLIILLLFNSSAISFSVISLLLSGEMIAESLISITSPLSFLKRFNIWTLLTENKFTDTVLYIFQTVIHEYYFILLLCFFISILCMIISLFLYQHSIKRQITFSFPFQKTSFFSYSLQEVLFQGRALLLILIITAWSIISIQQYTVVKSDNDIAYESFKKDYYGLIDDTLFQRIEEEREVIQQAQLQYDELTSKLNTGETLSEEENEALIQASNQLVEKDYLNEMYDEIIALQDVGATYYSDTNALQLLVYKNNTMSFIINYLLTIIPIIVIIASVLCPFYKNGLYKLVFSAKKGKKKYIRHEFLLFFILGILFMLIVYGSHTYKILSNHSYYFSNISIRDLLGVNFSMSIIGWYILLTINRLLTLITIIVVTMRLCQKHSLITTSLIMLLIVCMLLISPIGLQSLLRYDFLNHLFFYIVGILLEIILIIYFKYEHVPFSISHVK